MENSHDFKLVAIIYHPSEELWELNRQYDYIDQQKQWKIIIEENSKYDLSSIPRLFWKIVSPFELSNEAPLIHDYLYVTEGGRRKDPKHRLKGKIESIETISPANSDQNELYYTRKEADLLFREIMKQAQVKPWRIFLGFWTVYIVNSWRKWA